MMVRTHRSFTCLAVADTSNAGHGRLGSSRRWPLCLFAKVRLPLTVDYTRRLRSSASRVYRQWPFTIYGLAQRVTTRQGSLRLRDGSDLLVRLMVSSFFHLISLPSNTQPTYLFQLSTIPCKPFQNSTSSPDVLCIRKRGRYHTHLEYRPTSSIQILT